MRCFGIQPEPRLRLAATGHRQTYLPTATLYRIASAFLAQLRPDQVVSGMALGWDTAFALAAVTHDIPLVACVPHSPAAQQRGMRPSQVARHGRLLDSAAQVEVIGEGYGFTRACDLRNRWMVEHADLLAAWWSGRNSGTANCIRYAARRGVPLVNLYGLPPA